MSDLSQVQHASRQKTLLISLLLSAPGALVTGISVLSSHSTTQLADFMRRTMEAVALFVSWWIYRRLHGSTVMTETDRVRLERVAGFSVAAAMIGSSILMLMVALSRLTAFVPGGNVLPGLAIAVLGIVTNGWFWRRYTRMLQERYDAVIAAQQQLYRAKTSVDLCVLVALAAVAVAPAHPVTPYIDILGSVAVAGYLFFSGVRTARSQLAPALPEGSSPSS